MERINLMSTPSTYVMLIGWSYFIFGVLGVLCNVTTVLMICTNRVYRLSAYTLMANVALADCVIMIISGIGCGMDILWPDSWYHVDAAHRVPRASYILSDESLVKILISIASNTTIPLEPTPSFGSFLFTFSEVAAWTAGVLSYALLGLNRCIAICYYGTKARRLNQVSVAIVGSIITWVVGFAVGIVGAFPDPLIGIRRDMWSVSLLEAFGNRRNLFIILVIALNAFSVIAQWFCSILVLLKIRQVKEKISRNKLNQNSANRFRKQARLTFQFFYPSVLCTLSTLVYLLKPMTYHELPTWILILLHLITLVNHTCNPFIYAYFNDRMRLTYREMITCSALRYHIRKRRTNNPFGHNQRHNVSRRSNAPGAKSNRMSTRSVRSRDGNFVRNSLQMQSRDFEQLCEFIMRVNPLYDSSEGWRESSDDEDFVQTNRMDLEAIREITQTSREDRESKSIVLDLGRQTVEHWVKFAKKASI